MIQKLKFLIAVLIVLFFISYIPRLLLPEKIKPIHKKLSKTREKVFRSFKKSPNNRSPETSTNREEARPHRNTAKITVCSFFIHNFGESKARDNQGLVKLLKNYDIVVIQGMIAPPYLVRFPDGRFGNPDRDVTEFFEEFSKSRFDYVLSPEDTGPKNVINRNNASTEWWVAFYRTERIMIADDLPHGFISEDRSNHSIFERVPYAFGFRTTDKNLDFVLISTHLTPGKGKKHKTRRHNEVQAIAEWIEANNSNEKDFVILGNMNIVDRYELKSITPFGYLSLNNECRQTNTDLENPYPFDHIFYSQVQTSEIDFDFDMIVVDLKKAMKPAWKSKKTFPGDPYDHNKFRKTYSDHHPILFKFDIPPKDDD